MFKLFLTALQLLWPFVKESILEGGTIGDWVKRNRIACLWIFLLLAMLTATIWMADIILTISKQNTELTTKNQQLTSKYNGLVGKYNTQLSQLKIERHRLARLRILVADSCPADSRAYRTLVMGLQTLDLPGMVGDRPTAQVWCEAVREEDMANDMIRQQFLMSCQETPSP